MVTNWDFIIIKKELIYMENTYTIKELVEMHGSIQQKDHFEKYGTFKSGNMKDALLKEAKRYYCPPYNSNSSLSLKFSIFPFNAPTP